jgi:hypothetical protein
MKDNLTENNDEKDKNRKETKTLEQSILDDIDAYDVKNENKIETKEIAQETVEDKKESSGISESVISEEEKKRKSLNKQFKLPPQAKAITR